MSANIAVLKASDHKHLEGDAGYDPELSQLGDRSR